MRNYTQVFFGKTEVDIENQFAKWQQDKAGFVFDIERHPTKPLEMKPAPKMPAAFAMLIEFKRKPINRSPRKKQA